MSRTADRGPGEQERAEVPTGSRTGWRRALRTTVRYGVVTPALVLPYVAWTRDQPNRPAMTVVSLLLMVISVALALGAIQSGRSRRERTLATLAVLAHVVGYATLAHLDGGVTGPLGDVVFFLMVFTAVTLPFRQFLVVMVAAVGAYATVAVTGPRPSPGYALMSTVSFVVISLLLARHAQALASLRRRLTEISRIDPLTGCLNRRAFDERLAAEIFRAARTGGRFSLVVADLDSFKSVNDTYGHRVGDDVLAWTGHVLRSTLDAPHAVARLGGDEFAILLPDVDGDRVASVIAPCRAALDEVAPASAGHAAYPAEATDAHQLLQVADQRLYVDKAARIGIEAPDGVDRAVGARSSAEPTRVSALERRRRSVIDTGVIALTNFGIGCVYVATGSGGTSSALFALLLLGFAIALALIVGAGAMVRARHAGAIMGVVGPVLFGVAIVSAVLDGGVNSVIALGMLNPLLVISLTAPRKVVLPLGAVVAVAYLAMGLLIGAPSRWYVATHLLGILVISLTCVSLGRAAAVRRQLLTHRSGVDGLTGCLNRRGFEERFESELRRLPRQGGGLSILVLDLDGFKDVNDNGGHAAGDELLRWVGETMPATLRGHDVVGRLGGDEFIALLSDCPETEAELIAERLRRALADRIGVSLGTATLGPHGSDLDSLYRHADAALYVEKARHRAARRQGPATSPPPGGTTTPTPPPGNTGTVPRALGFG